MVTLTNPNNILEEPNRWVGLSTDSKPDTAHNGDEFVEMDTSKQYMYDEESSDWVEVTVSGGGGGGGLLFNVLQIPGDYGNGDTLDEETLAAVNEAVWNNGQCVMFVCNTNSVLGTAVCIITNSGTIVRCFEHTEADAADIVITLDFDTGEISVTLN